MLFAGAIGCAIAWVSLRFLSQWTPSAEIPVQVDVRPDAWVLTLSLLVSVATGLLAGLVPASHAWRLSASDARTGGSSIGRRRIPVRDVILLLQTAVCCAVVVGALVAVRGLARTVHTRPGYDADGVSAVGFDANLAHYSADEADRFQRRALEAVAQLPGVRAAAYAKSVPLSSDQSTTTVFPEAAVDRRPGEGRNVPYYSVSPGFFDAMGTRLLAGREFGWRDGRGAPPVAIVNETFARQFFGTVDAAGRRVRGFGGRLIQIVGVVEDGKYFTVAEDPRPVLFWSILQQRDTETVLLVRSGTAEAVMAGEMARVVRTLEPAMPLYGVGSLHDVLSFAYLPAQMASAAFGGFGLLAVMLAVTGVYSVSSYAVTRRRREIGIRIAIGARGLQVLGSVLGRIAVIVLAGATLGLVLGFASSRLLAFVVYQASPRDPLTLTLTAAFMIAVALVAGLGPIRQGIGADPCMLLHEE
jgi:predicted permease